MPTDSERTELMRQEIRELEAKAKEATAKEAAAKEAASSGTDNNYWLVNIAEPKRLSPYDAECEDIIEALKMDFQEGEAFKAIWRKAGQRLGNTAIRDAEKVAHFGARMVVMEKRNGTNTSTTLGQTRVQSPS